MLFKSRRLEFISEYDPKKIAVINIKDLNGVKNAINIITPDGSKIYQSITPAGKTEWIEQFEVAFRWDQQQKKPKKGPAPQPPKPNNSNNLTVDISPTDSQSAVVRKEENMAPDWIHSATDEIETFIAQRHFEDAESLIKRCKDFLQQSKTFVGVVEIEEKVMQLERQLADVLLQELSKCHARNLEVALRSTRRCLQILVNMGKARQASGTLLKVCSIGLRTAQKEARKNNAKISELFFCDLAQVACAFLLSFESQPACVSGELQLTHFYSRRER